jgi:ubiquinone/menaquinone biosynthesis C-methylase UbiE
MKDHHEAGKAAYIHGTSASEQERLTALNDLINEACLRELQLRGGERILDVGSGLMQFSRAMARHSGSRGLVIAIESNPAQIAEARRQALEAGEDRLVDLRQGDAYEFPLTREEWGTFDLVHARFLLEHLQDPARVVAQMNRAARPGGRIVLADDDHDTLRLTPESPAFDRLWRAYIHTYESAGCDPFIGRHLVGLLHDAGARSIRNTHLFFGSCAGQRSFPLLATNLVVILEGARAAMEREATPAPIIDDGLAALDRWRQGPDAAFWYSICWAEGTVVPVRERRE